MKKYCVLFLFLLLILQSAVVLANCDNMQRNDKYYRDYQKYEHIYMNPPRKSLETNGRYVMVSSGVRYVHSPSKLKRAAHAARVDANNYEYGNY